MHPSSLLARRTWQEIGGGFLLVPVGSTEQHGPHLPLSVDTVVATAVADELARRCRAAGQEALVAPAVAYGASGEHEQFPGTVSIGTRALALLLLELGRSASAWAQRIVFVNGHGGNLDALAEAVPRLRDEGRDAAWLPCAAPAADPQVGDSHAGRTETSLVARLRPDDVRWERAEPGASEPLPDLLPRLRIEGVRAVSPNGVLGDPFGASAAEGARLLDAMTDTAWVRLRHGRVAANGCLVPGETGVADA